MATRKKSIDSGINPDDLLKIRIKRLKTLDFGDCTLEFVAILQNLIMIETLKPSSATKLQELLSTYDKTASNALLIYKTQMEAGWDSDMDIEEEAPVLSLVKNEPTQESEQQKEDMNGLGTSDSTDSE